MRFPKRRANLLYKLRRKGIEADTKQRVIFIPYTAKSQPNISKWSGSARSLISTFNPLSHEHRYS